MAANVALAGGEVGGEGKYREREVGMQGGRQGGRRECEE